jgi:phage terminase small subunit
MSEANGLTDKQKLFIESYLQCWNATQAARDAGYSGNDNTLGSIGSENLTKPKIREHIKQRLNTIAMSTDEVLARLSEQARGDIGDLLGPSGMVIDIQTARERGLTHLIKSLNWTRGGLKVELYDSQKALELLGRAHGMFRDVQEHSGAIRIEYVNDWRDPSPDAS